MGVGAGEGLVDQICEGRPRQRESAPARSWSMRASRATSRDSSNRAPTDDVRGGCRPRAGRGWRRRRL